jgi:peroxiredoxin
MLRRRSILLVAAAVVALPAGALSVEQQLPRVTAFDLRDLHGQAVTRSAWSKHRAVVVVCLGTECPVSNGYAPELRRLHERFVPSGVGFYGVYCEPGITADAARKHAAEFAIPFTLLVDPALQLAGQIGARRMPEVAVLSTDGQVLYRGRIDNRYQPNGQRRIEATTHELSDAIEAVLAHKSPNPNQTEAFGCPLPRVRLSTKAKER